MKKAGAFTFEITRDGIEARLGEMEKKTERLRSAYESFFMGVERMPPNTLRRDMNRLMLEMQQVPIANSSLRFRFQALSQKWVLLITYWNRTLREIEAGTFRRDLARAQRHMEERGGFITEEEALTLGIPKNRVKAFVARQQRTAARKANASQNKTDRGGEKAAAIPPPAEAAPASSHAPPVATGPRKGPPPIPPPVSPGLVGISERDFEEAYDQYYRAHQTLGMEAEVKSKDRVRSQLSKILPKIMQERGCANLKLEVAVEEGKVRLRAWPAQNTTTVR